MTRRFVVRAAVLVVLGGCAADYRMPPTGTESDAGPASLRPDSGPISREIDSGPPSDLDATAGLTPDAVARACRERAALNADGQTGCDTAECAAILPSCCAGSGACCVDEPVAAASFRAEASCDTLACLTGARPFGAPASAFSALGLVPGGDANADSGVVLGGALDLAQQVVLAAEVAVPACAGGDCLDGVALGVVSESAALALGAQSTVVPLVGFVASTARQELSLLSGGRVVASGPLPAGSRAVTVTLTLGRDAALTLEAGATILRGEAPLVTGLGRVVVYGRSRGAEPARLLALTTRQRACDEPTRWSTRAPATLGTATAPRQATVREGGGVTRVAYAADGALHFATYATGAFTDAPTVVRGEAGEQLSDPELVFDGAAWSLFHTVRTPSGEPRIDVRVADGSDGFGAPLTALDLTQASVAARLTLTSIDGATVAFGTPWTMVVHGADAEGDVLLRFVSSDGVNWEAPIEGAQLTKPDQAAESPDRDGLSAPVLVRASGFWQLLYTARRGARTSIVQLVSDDAVHFRSLGAVLEGTGAGFDALGVAEPAAWQSADGTLRLLYEGVDGTSGGLGLATRRSVGRN